MFSGPIEDSVIPCFQPGEGPSRGLLRDCTTSPINRFAALLPTHSLTLSRHLRAVFGSIQPQYTAEAALTKRLSEVVLLGQIKLCAYFL